MEVENKKQRISFMTTEDRKMFPMHVPPNRFGNDLAPLRGDPHRGPGCYNNEEVSNLLYQVDTYNTSNKGYALGARTAPRFRKEPSTLTPDPTTYQTTTTEPRTFEEDYKAFQGGAARFPEYKKDLEVSPGPGTYEFEEERNRKVQWHSSFGGPPINLPSVKQHSTIDPNTSKLLSTTEEKKYQRRLAYLKLYWDKKQ